jgi:hypothetical protein
VSATPSTLIYWGRTFGASPIRIGGGVTAIGLILVLITIALGG